MSNPYLYQPGPVADVDAGDALFSDTVDLTKPARGVFVGTGGDLVVITTGITSKEVTFKNLQDGQELYVPIKRIKATGTTAADVIILY